MSNSQVTVIIPTFNRKELLKTSINSVLSQTYPSSIIVVDHGSTDGTKDIMKQYQPEVNYIRREKDLGIHFNWLEGLLSADTEYVKILFDDDIMKPNYLKECLKLFNPEVGFVFSRCNTIDLGSLTQFDNLFDYDKGTGVYLISSFFGYRVTKQLISPSALIIRRKDAIDALYQGALPLQNDTYRGVGPDHFIKLINCLRYPKFGYVQETLVSFGVHDGSITINASKEKESRIRLQKAYKDVLDYYLRLSLIYHKNKFLSYFFYRFLGALRNIFKHSLL